MILLFSGLFLFWNVMSLLIDNKFARLLGSRLERFSQKSANKYQFRCPVCGDSKKSKTKTRGTLYKKNEGLSFHCFNCHSGMRFSRFLEKYGSDLYKDYLYETLSGGSAKSKGIPTILPGKMEKIIPKERLEGAKRIDELSSEHSAVQYIKKRLIPTSKWNRLYYTDDFGLLVRTNVPNYDRSLFKEERIVIPFWDENKKLLGFQGRALDPNKKQRYITISMNDLGRKVYGLDSVDLNKKIIVVEGPIDSLFLDNAIATMDSSLYRVEKTLGKRDYLFVYDNQPLNSSVTKALYHTINLGYDVVIWENETEGKDINDMVLAGIDPNKVLKVRTFNGLQAKLEFNKWNKTKQTQGSSL